MKKETIVSNGRVDWSQVFEVVDKVPYGYFIWNINESHMPKGYLPLCQLSAYQPFIGARSINLDTLKAIKTEGVSEMLNAAGYGFTTLKEIENCINTSKNQRDVKVAKKSIAICPINKMELVFSKWRNNCE